MSVLSWAFVFAPFLPFVVVFALLLQEWFELMSLSRR